MSVPHDSDLSSQVREELENQLLRVKPFAIARLVWEREFTTRERQKLGGDLEQAFRQFRSTPGMWMHVRKVPLARAILDIAILVGTIDKLTFDWLMREIGERATDPEKPSWNENSLQLLFKGEIVRRVVRRNAAKNILCIVRAFEEAGWPDCIDDPLSHHDPQDLHASIQSLNKGMRMLRFHTDGSGRRVCWQFKGDTL